MSDFTIAFIGLPSSGKSSIINSLIGKRILESGICRTTTEYNLLDHIIEDDNNNKFKVMDLPGICDSEEHNVNFNELTNKHILNANLIIWTSDVNKAFITTHEVNEYNRIKKILDNVFSETGKLYYLIIMLSKCDKDISINKSLTKNKKKIKKHDEEISDSDEDTDTLDLINKVHEKFPSEDIVYFNAFGRSMFSDKSTETLKKFITKIGIPQTKYNITFNISKYIKNYDVKQTIIYYEHFQSKFILFKDSKFEITKLLEIWDNMTNENKNSFLSKLFEENFIPSLSEKWDTKILKICQFHSCDSIKNYNNSRIRYNELINYYLYILINTLTIKHDFTINELIEYINSSFKLLNYSQQEIFYNKLLFDYSFDCGNRVNIIKILDFSKKNYYNFEVRFNEYITSLLSDDDDNFDDFREFYNTINALIIDKKYKLKFDENKCVVNNFDDYIAILDNIVNDYDYILLNKVQIIFYIIGHNGLQRSDFYCSYNKLIISDYYIQYNRLKYNKKWLEKNNKIWRKIYSSLQVEYDFDIVKFEPINKFELLYDIKYNQDNEKYEDIENDNNSNSN